MIVEESHRIAGKVRVEHVAALGSVGEPATIAGRVVFWGNLHHRLDALSNRICEDDRAKIIGAIHARIPMVTIDEQRTLQRENAEVDEKLWSGLQDMSADMAKGQNELAAIASGNAAESEAQAKYAAGKAAAAKDRLNKLAKGEDVAGGLGNPRTREDFERILMDAGWSPDDIRFSVELARLRGDEEFEAFLTQSSELRERTEKSTRWKVLRKIVAKRSHLAEDNGGIGVRLRKRGASMPKKGK